MWTFPLRQDTTHWVSTSITLHHQSHDAHIRYTPCSNKLSIQFKQENTTILSNLNFQANNTYLNFVSVLREQQDHDVTPLYTDCGKSAVKIEGFEPFGLSLSSVSVGRAKRANIALFEKPIRDLPVPEVVGGVISTRAAWPWVVSDVIIANYIMYLKLTHTHTHTHCFHLTLHI